MFHSIDVLVMSNEYILESRAVCELCADWLKYC